MNLGTKRRIAQVLCVLFMIATVVAAVLSPTSPSSGIFLTFALAAGLRAARWKKQNPAEPGPATTKTTPVAPSARRRGVVPLVELFLFLVIAALFFWGGLRLHRWQQLRGEALITTGSVLYLEDPSPAQPGYLTYEFYDQYGAYYSSRIPVHPSTCLTLHVGGRVPVRYLPTEPWIHYVDLPLEEGSLFAADVAILLIAGFLLVCLAAWRFHRFVQNRRRQAAAAPSPPPL